MPEGRVIRSHSNIYYVLVENQELECRPRGKLRLDGTGVMCGDLVEVTPLAQGEGRIDSILPRRSVLQRPAVANVDQAVIVFTLAEPEENRLLLDRFLVHAEHAGVQVVIAVNKVDLVAPEQADAFTREYGRIGYPVVPISARQGLGLDALLPLLAGRASVLAGQSGVGKSRLMQALVPGGSFRVGDLTTKLRRGRHTTRHVELIRLENGGLLADSPGFTYLTFEWMESIRMQQFFPEFQGLAEACRFADCLHRAEPECAVRAALDADKISPARYAHYLTFLEEVENIKRW